MASWILLGLALGGALHAWNVHRPTYAPVRPAILPFLLGWLVSSRRSCADERDVDPRG